jgi:apolipoprotein N-acyltransferase
MLRAYKPSVWTFVSGVLIVLAFTPWEITPLIWVALIPWFYALSKIESPKRAAIEGLWLSIFMSLFGFSWIQYVLGQFAGLPLPVSLLGFFLFTLINQPQFVVFGAVWGGLKPGRSRLPLILIIALCLFYAGMDWFIPKLFVDTMGHAFYSSSWIRQSADLGGAWFLTFWVILVNFLGLEVLKTGLQTRKWKETLHQEKKKLGAVLGILLALSIYGFFRNRQIEAVPLISKIPMAIIQANIGDFEKLASERGVAGAADQILGTFFQMSDQALTLTPKPLALLWPETSYPSTFRTPQNPSEMIRDQNLDQFVTTRNTPLFFGGYDRDGRKDFNSFFFLQPRPFGMTTAVHNEADLLIYHKNILLLFGEYIPGMESIPFLMRMFPQIGNFGRGPGPESFPVNVQSPSMGQVQVAPVICYEALFPNYLIGSARKGAQMIANITNDSWFGDRGEPELHLSLTVFRSIETRLPQARATNTGISALILPSGRIGTKSSIGKAEILPIEVPITPPIWTLMKAWGDWFSPLALILGSLGLGFIRYRHSRKSA